VAGCSDSIFLHRIFVYEVVFHRFAPEITRNYGPNTKKLPHKRKNDTEFTIIVPPGESGESGIASRSISPRHCERSEAIHVTENLWVAASLPLLAMTYADRIEKKTPGTTLHYINSKTKNSDKNHINEEKN